jgi:hypothetical protein
VIGIFAGQSKVHDAGDNLDQLVFYVSSCRASHRLSPSHDLVHVHVPSRAAGYISRSDSRPLRGICFYPVFSALHSSRNPHETDTH